MSNSSPARLRYVNEVVKPSGDRFYYYRRDGRRISLRGPEGSVTFLADYDAAHVAFESGTVDQPRHPVSAVIAHYRKSAAFRKLKLKSKAGSYEPYLDRLRDMLGGVEVSAVDEAWVGRLRDASAERPILWNKIRNVGLVAWREYRRVLPAVGNPWADADRLKEALSDQNRPWPRDVIRQVFSAATPEFRAFLNCQLLLTQRTGDASLWAPENYDAEARVLAFPQSKTGTPMRLAVPGAVHDDFMRTSGRAPGRLLCTPRGRPWKPANAQESLATLLRILDLPRYTIHGLRATGATALLDLGWSARAVMALTGHDSERAFNHYVRGADKSSLSAPGPLAIAKHLGGSLNLGLSANVRAFTGVTGRAAAKLRREDGLTTKVTTVNSVRKRSEKSL